MKKIHLLFLLIFFVGITTSCDKILLNPNRAYEYKNVHYASGGIQVMDVYLPAHRNKNTTKVFVLVHGGSWSGGDKSDMNGFYTNLKELFPNTAIINLNYRLGSANNPGYPKQMEDIQKAIKEIQKSKYNVSKQYFFIGVSAGAHLSMLYSYAFDDNHEVQGVCNTVGPADLMDPELNNLPLSMALVKNLVGNKTQADDSDFMNEVSPVYHITESSPKTISFYGDADPLIPTSQMNLLHNKLDSMGVYNEKTMYPGGGHANWNQAQGVDYSSKMYEFIVNYFIE